MCEWPFLYRIRKGWRSGARGSSFLSSKWKICDRCLNSWFLKYWQFFLFQGKYARGSVWWITGVCKLPWLESCITQIQDLIWWISPRKHILRYVRKTITYGLRYTSSRGVLPYRVRWVEQCCGPKEVLPDIDSVWVQRWFPGPAGNRAS